MTLTERYQYIIDWFRANMPDPKTELNYDNPFQLLIAVILSAQCTDKRVNMVTPKLFADFPTPEVLAASQPEIILSYISSISYPNNKAKNLVGMAQQLITKFQGIIPENPSELQQLPGVGRKTANVVASVVYHQPAMAVDTHVFRISERLGLTSHSKNPLQTELTLTQNIPSEYLAKAHHWLLLHARYICQARKPKCAECGLSTWCQYYHNR